ncbi:YccF domain-containing protein [Sheuella amnicola]|uniref:YccF domain-containing protein n=1 Tax=Sheuella amnicola TaxID=2707330 RepID=UPI002883340F|nr:YccF domain-containing protein [Sheuella amnicola]
MTQAELQKYRKISGAGHKTSITEQTFRITSGFLNIVWMFTFGWILALVHFVSAVINLAFFWMIFTIPNISGNWKLMSVALMPFNKVIVPSEIAKEIRIAISRNQLNI